MSPIHNIRITTLELTTFTTTPIPLKLGGTLSKIRTNRTRTESALLF